MSSSTSINELPNGDNTNNVQMNIVSEQPQQQQPQQQPPSQQQQQQQNVSLDPNTINQIVNELHQATLTGSTKLASRDIPIDTNPIQTDNEAKPNYVPEEEKKYIPDEGDIQTIIQKQSVDDTNTRRLDALYNELQTPILIGVLYFLFQLPVLKKTLYKTFPILFNNDGNLSINGYLFYSSLFSITYYFMNRFICVFDKF